VSSLVCGDHCKLDLQGMIACATIARDFALAVVVIFRDVGSKGPWKCELGLRCVSTHCFLVASLLAVSSKSLRAVTPKRSRRQMSNHWSGSSTEPLRRRRGSIATHPSVGRFKSEQRPTLYVQRPNDPLSMFNDPTTYSLCSTTQRPTLHDLVVRKSMAPRSNHGQLTEQPTGIVDLRKASATATEGKTCGS
jgi:hypothetical protein